jgi:hypothetical protein
MAWWALGGALPAIQIVGGKTTIPTTWRQIILNHLGGVDLGEHCTAGSPELLRQMLLDPPKVYSSTMKTLVLWDFLPLILKVSFKREKIYIPT